MAKLTQNDVENIAKLAKLDLNQAEKEKFANQLSGVLEYVELLKEVDTDGVEPTAQVTGMTDITRDDVVSSENVTYAEIAINAPTFESGAFEVPYVFKSE